MFCLLIISEMVLQYYRKDVIEKSELARGTVSSGLGIKVRPVGRRGNCQCNREGKIALSLQQWLLPLPGRSGFHAREGGPVVREPRAADG